MASPGAVASSLKGRIWNPRKSDLFPSFDAEIILDRNVIRPYKSITGKLILTTSRTINFKGGIRVQLDANVRLRFVTKLDNRSTKNWALEGILEGSPEAEDGSYVLSPIRQQLMGEEEDTEESLNIQDGTWEFPFSLQMSGESLPAPFKSQWGSLQYNVTAYMGSQYCYVQIAEQLVGFAGFKDLTRCPEAAEPLFASSVLSDSIFSNKPCFTFTLESERCGYHPGEQISFKLTIDNPKEREVKTVVVKLVRRVTYNAAGAVKNTNITIDSYEVGDGECGCSNDKEIFHENFVSVPKHCVPTYTGREIYALTYFLQYEVTVSDHPGVGKGQAEVLIGTTKPSAAMLVNKMNSRRESSPFVHNDTEDSRGDGGNHEESNEEVRPRSHSICARSRHRPVVFHLNGASERPTSASKTTRAISMMSLSDAQ